MLHCQGQAGCAETKFRGRKLHKNNGSTFRGFRPGILPARLHDDGCSNATRTVRITVVRACVFALFQTPTREFIFTCSGWLQLDALRRSSSSIASGRVIESTHATRVLSSSSFFFFFLFSSFFPLLLLFFPLLSGHLWIYFVSLSELKVCVSVVSIWSPWTLVPLDSNLLGFNFTFH